MIITIIDENKILNNKHCQIKTQIKTIRVENNHL